MCTIVLPFGKYRVPTNLPMGLCNSPDIFQEKMSELMEGLEFMSSTYHRRSTCVSRKDTYRGPLGESWTLVFSRLRRAGLKVNAKKSFFARGELEYLGYWVTRDGIQPVQKKVKAIMQIAEPKTKKELHSFIGIVNYYRDMWVRRSHILAPLAKLTSKTAKWEWTSEQRQAFLLAKKVIARQTMLAYPDFNKPFQIHTDASHLQLGAVISQDGKPIAFYSRKLNPAQTRYTTMERELLSIVETLKEYQEHSTRSWDRSFHRPQEPGLQTLQHGTCHEVEATLGRVRALNSPTLRERITSLADALSRMKMTNDDFNYGSHIAADDEADFPPTLSKIVYREILPTHQQADAGLKNYVDNADADYTGWNL